MEKLVDIEKRLIQLRHLRGSRDKKQISLASKIDRYQKSGKIKTYYIESGYVAYDPVEFEKAEKNVKIGRPFKFSNQAKVKKIRRNWKWTRYI